MQMQRCYLLRDRCLRKAWPTVMFLSLKLMSLPFYKGCQGIINNSKKSTTLSLDARWNMQHNSWHNLHPEGFSVHPLGVQMWQTHICPKVTTFVRGKNSMSELSLLTHPIDIPERPVTIFTFFTVPCWEKTSRRSLSLTWTQFKPFKFEMEELKKKKGHHNVTRRSPHVYLKLH